MFLPDPEETNPILRRRLILGGRPASVQAAHFEGLAMLASPQNGPTGAARPKARGRRLRTVASSVDLAWREIRNTEPSVLRVHIAPATATQQTVCTVEGALDGSSSEHLADAIRVALVIEPRHSVLLDLTQVSSMVLLDVCEVIDQARHAQRHRQIVVRPPLSTGPGEAPHR